jgi:hypothetical protein
MSSGTCLEISAKSANFSTQAPGLTNSPSAKAIKARHQQWAKQLPQDEGDLWQVLVAFDRDSQARTVRTLRVAEASDSTIRPTIQSSAIRAGERPVEDLNDPHATTAAGAGFRNAVDVQLR